MAEISLKVQPQIKSRKLPNALEQLGRLPVELDKIDVLVVRNVRRNCSGRYLHRRTGRLHDSWEYVLSRLSNLGWQLSVQSDLGQVPYARIHDLGGMTGRGHKTKIRKTSYATRAFVQSKTQIKRILRDYMTRLFRG
jgi:phage gpG-like protein